jgi:SAM-dependent methyltransferase
MKIHKILEKPAVYDLCQKILSFIAAGNKGMGNFLRNEVGSQAGSVLEVGCGTGRFAGIFGERYTGVDNNPKYIEYAKNKYPGRFLTVKADQIEKLGEKFDYVLSICTLHHLTDEEVVSSVKKMVDLAQKKVYIIDPVYPTSRWNFLGRLLFSLDRGRYQRTLGGMIDLLEPMGFEVRREGLENSYPYQVCVFVGQARN